MGGNQPLQGRVLSNVEINELSGSQKFINAPVDQKVDFLAQSYLPKRNPRFAQGTIEQRKSFINARIMPEIATSFQQQGLPSPFLSVTKGLKERGLGSFVAEEFGLPEIKEQALKDIATQGRTFQETPIQAAIKAPLLFAGSVQKRLENLAQGAVNFPIDIANITLGTNIPLAKTPSSKIKQLFEGTKLEGFIEKSPLLPLLVLPCLF